MPASMAATRGIGNGPRPEPADHRPRKDGRGLGAVDRQIVDQAPAIGLLVPQGVDLISKRVHNYQHNPVSGVILSQLWVV